MFSRRESNTQRVVALDARAEALRLRTGIGVAEARATHPCIEIVEADPEADRQLLTALADWCDRYTPLVALDGDDGLFLDITGCAHLFGGERAMLEDVLARLFSQGFDVRAGLASTPGAAWAAARHGAEAIVEPGNEHDIFAPLPLAALRLDGETITSLESVGLRIVGALMNAPRAPLVRRFGKMVTLRLDQALGEVEEPISPRLPAPLLSVERRFFEPISLIEDIEALILLLAQQLKLELERRAEGGQHLQLQLFRVDGAVSRIDIAISRPTREPKLIGRLFHEKLGSVSSMIDPGYGFDLVRLAVLAASPFDAKQTSLDAAVGDPDDDIALFADRVRARFGNRAIGQPRLVASHLPERASAMEPFSLHQEEGTAQTSSDKDRPVRLFGQPEYIEVTVAEIPEGPPAGFRWRHVSYRVARAEGPERIAPEWWRDASAVQTRDYFRIEDEEGRRYWLYREGFYSGDTAAPRWFMQGMFA